MGSALAAHSRDGGLTLARFLGEVDDHVLEVLFKEFDVVFFLGKSDEGNTSII